jgi:prepilin-type processing-associated H-X9-DG protein
MDTRAAAASFSTLQNENISYFVGVNADFSRPASILAGDRNITGASAASTILRADGGNRLQWTAEMHRYKGNMLFADGHVEQWNSTLLADNSSALAGAGAFFLPTINPHRPSPIAAITTANPVSNRRSTPLSQSFNPPSSGVSAPATSPVVSPPQPAPSAMAELNGRHAVGKNISSQNEVQYFVGTNPAGVTASNASVMEPAPAPAADLSTFDQKAVTYFQAILKWSYFLLLLLLLLLLAFELWRRSQRRKTRATKSKRPGTGRCP